MRMRTNLSGFVLIFLACAATCFAGTKCKYGAKVSRLQVSDGGLLTWTLAKRPATCVNHFLVCWGEVGRLRKCSSEPASSRNTSLEGLLPCRWHNVSVTAVADSTTPAHTSSLLHFVAGDHVSPKSLEARPRMMLVQPNRIVITVNHTEDPEDKCYSHYTACWSAEDSPQPTCKKKRSHDNVLETGRLQLCSSYVFTFWTSLLDKVNSSVASFEQFTGVGDVQDVRITTVGPNSIGVRWLPPAEDGDCAELYRVVHDSGSAEVSANTTEYLVTGLLPCKHYFVEVHSMSSRGTWSNAVRRRAITRPSVPGVVRDLHVHWTASRRLLVQWKAPMDTHYCHVRYSICWRKSGVDNERCARQKLSPYPSLAIGKLKPCTEYTVKVAVLGAEKVLGDATAFRTTTGPEPVANLKVWETSSANQKVLRWEQPECAQSYLVCWGAWGGAGRYSCANTTDTSFSLAEDHRGSSPDTLTYSVVAVSAEGATSDRALVNVVW